MTAMIFSLYSRYSLLLIGALLTVACQPPAASDRQAAAKNSDPAETPIIIDADSVTMSQQDILTIKPSRYQPSLGLQGRLKPMQQVRFIAGNPLIIQKVLVTQGQWVEKNEPLMIVLRQTAAKIAEDSQGENAAAQVTDITSAQPNTPNITTSNRNTPNNSNLALTEFSTADTLNPTNQALADNTPSQDNNNHNNNEPPSSAFITVRAPFAGRIDELYSTALQHVTEREPLLHLSNDNDLHFIATLPLQAEPQLSIGQTVNFTTDSMIDKFTGQVSQLIKAADTGKLLVYVNVVKNEVSRGSLKPDMVVTGRVDYGQIEVGTIVPKSAINEADLTELHKQPYQPLLPLTAQVWIIQQNQRLTRQQVEVISFDPSTEQYLIAGVNNDSLICLASLPLSAVGKKVIIS